MIDFITQAVRENGNNAPHSIEFVDTSNWTVTSADPDNPFVYDHDAAVARVTELQADYTAKQYQRDRQPEYPSLADLADALYWSNQGDNTKLDEYYAACAAVKLKYPKPEVN
jgi:hypothetical protein